MPAVDYCVEDITSLFSNVNAFLITSSRFKGLGDLRCNHSFCPSYFDRVTPKRELISTFSLQSQL